MRARLVGGSPWTACAGVPCGSGSQRERRLGRVAGCVEDDGGGAAVGGAAVGSGPWPQKSEREVGGEIGVVGADEGNGGEVDGAEDAENEEDEEESERPPPRTEDHGEDHGKDHGEDHGGLTAGDGMRGGGEVTESVGGGRGRNTVSARTSSSCRRRRPG